MATDLGKVGMVMKGDYNSASTYEALDMVSYQNGLYVSKQNVPAGTAPTNSTYWQVAFDGNLPATDISSAITPESGVVIHSAKKMGRLILINFYSSPILEANAEQLCFTISADYRPLYSITSSTLGMATTSDFGYGSAQLGVDGQCKAIYSKATTYGLNGMLIYYS